MIALFHVKQLAFAAQIGFASFLWLLEKAGRCGHRPLQLGFGFVERVGRISRTKNINPPEGGTGGCRRRKTALFSPLYRGEGLSGEHAAGKAQQRARCYKI